MSEVALDDLAEDWAAVKLLPPDTGLPMAVWITQNDGYTRDIRVKVATVQGGRGSWPASPSMGVRPQPQEIRPGSLPAADVRRVARWIDLNRDLIIEYWDNDLMSQREVLARLRRLP
jgi:hypothetical protein